MNQTPLSAQLSSRRYLLLIVVALMGLAVAQGPPVARAAAITVTSTAVAIINDGNCTLPEAIQAAQTNAAVDLCAAGSAVDTDTITFSGAGIGTIQLNGNELFIDSKINIVGPASN